MKFEDYKFLAIGSYCLSVYALGQNRIKGPVDNVLIEGVKALELLFNNKYFEYIKDTKPQEIPKKYPENEEAPVDFYFPKVVSIVHNNIKNEKYFINLKNRIIDFNSYIATLQKDPKKMLVFTISYKLIDIKTGNMLNNELEQIIKYLKTKNCLNKVIFVCATKKKEIKRQTWWNNCLNKKTVDSLKNKYNINYIELTNLDLSTPNGKTEANKQFKEKVCKLLSELEAKNKKPVTSIKKSSTKPTSYLGYESYGI